MSRSSQYATKNMYMCRHVTNLIFSVSFLTTQLSKFGLSEKQFDVKIWLNWIRYEAVLYSLNCTLNHLWVNRLLCIIKNKKKKYIFYKNKSIDICGLEIVETRKSKIFCIVTWVVAQVELDLLFRVKIMVACLAIGQWALTSI